MAHSWRSGAGEAGGDRESRLDWWYDDDVRRRSQSYDERLQRWGAHRVTGATQWPFGHIRPTSAYDEEEDVVAQAIRTLMEGIGPGQSTGDRAGPAADGTSAPVAPQDWANPIVGSAGTQWTTYRAPAPADGGVDSQPQPPEHLARLVRDEIAADRRLREAREARQVAQTAEWRRREALQRVLTDWRRDHSYFDGRNATAYLRDFERDMRLLELTPQELIRAFTKIVDQRVEDRVNDLARETIDWREFRANVQSAFRAQDQTRMTPTAFVDWIQQHKTEPIDTILADYEVKYGELELRERAAFADKVLYFVKALPRELRVPFSEPLCDQAGQLTSDWTRVRARVRQMAGPMRYTEEVVPMVRAGLEHEASTSPTQGTPRPNAVPAPRAAGP